jgi:hypothetical protein
MPSINWPELPESVKIAFSYVAPFTAVVASSVVDLKVRFGRSAGRSSRSLNIRYLETDGETAARRRQEDWSRRLNSPTWGW